MYDLSKLSNLHSNKPDLSIYHEVFQLVNENLILVDYHGIIMDVNDYFLKNFKYSLSELLGKNIKNILVSKISLSEILESNSAEIYLANASNTHIKSTLHVKPIAFDKTKYALIQVEIHKFLQYKNKLITYLATILDNSKDHAAIKDLDLRIIAANKQLIQDAGLSSLKDIVGKTDLELYGDHPYVREYMKDELAAQKLKPGEYIEKEEKYVFPDGKEIRSLTRKFPIYDESNKVIATANISRDISYLKKIQNELSNSKEKYKQLIKNQGEGIGIVDNSEVFVFANPAAEKIFGVKKGLLVGRSIPEFLDNEGAKTLMRESINKSENIRANFELTIIRDDKQERHLLVTVTPYIKDYEYIGGFIIFRDITDRIIAERQLKESEQKLRELNATKDKFFSIIAHDLKNPFGSIMGFSELIKNKLQLGESQKIYDYAKHIYKASRQGFELLENLLEWSRAQRGKLKSNPERIEIAELVQHNISIVEQAANKKNIRLVADIKENLKVFVDEDMINTVLRNLLTNAIKFTNREGKIEVIVDNYSENNGYALVNVKDDGVGIEEEQQKHLFNIEYNKSTAGTENEEGTGLGLILCKEFVNQNGGEIWVETELEKGSQFKFTLPKAQ